jgi:hypothetical protein
MQHPQKTNLRASMLGVPCNRLEGLRHRLTQQRIHWARILQRQRAQWTGEGKNDVAVGHVQEFTLSSREPSGLRTALTLGAVPSAARVIADHLMPTVR